MDAKPVNRQLDRHNGFDLALNWRVLGLLNLYRILVPLVLISAYSLGSGRGIAVDSPSLFFSASLSYFCFGLISIILVRKRLASARRLHLGRGRDRAENNQGTDRKGFSHRFTL